MFADGLLKGRRILVTGGGSGLGKAMSTNFLKLGAEVHICGRRKMVCDDMAARWSATGSTSAMLRRSITWSARSSRPAAR